MKKLLTLAVAVLLALSIAAPAFAEVAPNGIRVGFANINEKGSFGKMVLQNMKKTAAERGYELICVDNNSD
ncbi:MAG: ABC transporter substrate-binding protein, partial [Clostridia bacterium]